MLLMFIYYRYKLVFQFLLFYLSCTELLQHKECCKHVIQSNMQIYF